MQRVVQGFLLAILAGAFFHQAGALAAIWRGEAYLVIQPPATISRTAVFVPSPAVVSAEEVLAAPLFQGAAKPSVHSGATTVPDEGDAVPESSVPLTLRGTITFGQGRGIAVIEDNRDKEQRLLHHGESVQGLGVTLAAVQRRRVLLDREGTVEALTLQEKDAPEPTPARATGGTAVLASSASLKNIVTRVGPTEFRIDERGRKEVFQNLPTLMREMALTPFMIDGQAQGFKIRRIREDSIYESLGFQVGDLIQGINGRDIRDVEDAMWMFQNLREERHFELRIERDGQSMTFSYDVR